MVSTLDTAHVLKDNSAILAWDALRTLLLPDIMEASLGAVRVGKEHSFLGGDFFLYIAHGRTACCAFLAVSTATLGFRWNVNL